MRAMRAMSAAARATHGYGRGRDGVEVLTLAALQRCLARQGEMEAFHTHSKEREGALTASEAAVQRQLVALEARTRTVDLTDATAVARHNASVRATEATVKQYNVDLERWRQDVAAMNFTVETFNRDCAGKRYYVDDHAAAMLALARGGH
jgi:hypothetical protein